MEVLQRRQVSVDGVNSPLIEAGPSDAAEAVVFVHGNPGSSRDFEDLAGRIGEFGRALAFDLPGFGRADKPADFDYTIEGYAGFIDRALEQLGVERVHLVVHDFGGAFGFCWAAGHPDALASAVMFNTGTWAHGRWHRAARLWRRPLVGELVMAITNRPGWRRALGGGDSRPLPLAMIDRMYDDFDRGTRRAVLRLYRATELPYPAASGWADALAELDRPALIVWGAKDPFLGRRRVENLKGPFPSAEVTMLPESGHFPFADDPKASAEAVVPFLRGRVSAGAPA